MRVLAAVRVARRAGQHRGYLAGLARKLPILIGEQTGDRPQLDRYLAKSQPLAGAKAFVAVGDHETLAHLNHGNRREQFTVCHRLAIALDALDGMRGGKEVKDLADRNYACLEPGARRIEA